MVLRLGERSLIRRRGTMPACQRRWSLYLGPLAGGAIYHATTLMRLIAVVRRNRRWGMGVYFDSGAHRHLQQDQDATERGRGDDDRGGPRHEQHREGPPP